MKFAMKKLFGIVLVFSFFWILPMSSLAGEKSITLKLAAITPPPGKALASDGVEMWMDKVTKETNGKVKFKAFWGASLTSPKAHMDLVEKGTVDLVLTHRWYSPSKFPLGQFEYVFPFGPTDSAVVSNAKRKIYEEFPAFKETLKKHNAIYICGFATTPYNFLSKTAIVKLDDFKGKKVSLVGRYFGRWVKAGGAIPVVAPMHDRYTMLQTGVVDMDMLPTDVFNTFKIQEVAPFFIEIDALVAIPFDLIMNLKKFDQLSPDIQKILLETGMEVERVMATEMVPGATKKVLAEWKKQGVTLIKFPAQERAKWAQLMPDIPAEWASEVSKLGLPGWEIIQRYQEICEELGYTWPRKWGIKK